MKFKFGILFFLIFFLLSCTNKKSEEQNEITEKDYSVITQMTVEDKNHNKINLSCIANPDGNILVCLEEYFDFMKTSYQVCPRCGNISVTLQNGDIILVQWNAPYIDYQNRENRITLPTKNLYVEGRTFCSYDFAKKIAMNELN